MEGFSEQLAFECFPRKMNFPSFLYVIDEEQLGMPSSISLSLHELNCCCFVQLFVVAFFIFLVFKTCIRCIVCEQK